MPKPNLDLQAGQPYSKDQVNYRQYTSCRTCANFNGRVGCNRVQGHISPDAVCDSWTLQESNQATEKETIMEAYKKETGTEFPGGD